MRSCCRKTETSAERGDIRVERLSLAGGLLGRIRAGGQRSVARPTSEGRPSLARMGISGSGEAARSVLKRRPLEHPYAIPAFPGSQGVWLLQQPGAPALGYLRTRPVQGGHVFDVYAHCRDDAGGRPRVHTASSFNASVAWAVQHSAEIRALIARSTPEPDVWPPPQ